MPAVYPLAHMKYQIELVAALATIAGTVVSLGGLVASGQWVALASLGFAGVSLTTALYAHKQRLKLVAANISVEGHHIDSLNVANLRRTVSRTFVLQEAEHIATIRGDDLHVTWRYVGFSRTDGVAAMEFNIDADELSSYAELDCKAFDLVSDPDGKHPIRPILLGNEGVSKKLAVPFLQPLSGDQTFKVQISFTLRDCLSKGFGYYTSTLSYAQDKVQRSTITVRFEGSPPESVRVYESLAGRPAKLVRALAPKRSGDATEFVDVADGRSGQSARIYVFWRE